MSDKDKKSESTAEKHADVQKGQDKKDKKKERESPKKKSKSKEAVQCGPCDYPVDMAEQHIEKPGNEGDLDLKPRFLAPHYKGSGKLEGFSTIITGGDSGIGRAVAVLFAREGADVAIVYLNEHQDAEETKKHIEKEGRRCILIPGDVTSEKFCQEAVQKTVAEFKRLDVLVNNAAFQLHADSIEDITSERLDLTFRTNIYGYFYMAKAAIPHMKKGGSIVNSGSVVGLQGSKDLLDYSSTKGAIHAFTKSLASSLLEKGIRVNAVAPGPVWTPLNPADKPAKKVKKFGQMCDYGRAAQPEELSPSYVFLASPCCSGYISGIVLPVTGSVGAI